MVLAFPVSAPALVVPLGGSVRAVLVGELESSRDHQSLKLEQSQCLEQFFKFVGYDGDDET